MPTVLIVVDDDVVRKILLTIFNLDSGFEARVEVANSVEAIVKVKQLLPNLAILGSSMREMNGLQLARRIKSIAPELPIFMLTTGHDAAIEKEALSCGVNALFSRFDDLATLVANARLVCGIE